MPADPGAEAVKALTVLGRRVPLPPATISNKWTWTKAKLRAVYLDAFTELDKADIARVVGAPPRTVREWRAQPDYRAYLAELVFTDGLADRVERTKARKGLADKLVTRLSERLEAAGPDLFKVETAAGLLRTLERILEGLAADTQVYEKNAEDRARNAPQRVGALNLSERLEAIADPAERERARAALLALFRDVVGAPAAAAPAQGESGMSDFIDVAADDTQGSETGSASQDSAETGSAPAGSAAQATGAPEGLRATDLQ